MSSYSIKESLLSGFQAEPSPSWKAVRSTLNRKRYHHGCVALDDNTLLVVGGYEKSSKYDVLRSVEVFDRQAQKWDKNWPKLNVNRAEFATVIVVDLLFVLGGRDGNGECLDSVECINLSQTSPKWVILDVKLSSKKCGCTAVAVGTLVYIMGGKNTNDGSTAQNHVDIFDASMHKRSKGPPLNQPRFACASVFLDGKIYVVGGNDDSDNSLNTIESLSVSSDGNNWASSWHTYENFLATPRMYPALSTISHCLVVIGGIHKGEKEHVLESVEIVDTKRDIIWQCVDLNQPIYGSAAVTLDDSRILLVGGCSNNQKPLNSSQILKLEFASYETHIAAVEREIKVLGGGKRSSLKKKVFGSGGGSISRKNKNVVSKLKAYLKELTKQNGSTRNADYSVDSDVDSGDEIARYFEKGLPSYDSGGIVATKELVNSGQAVVYRGTMRNKEGGKNKQDVAIKVFKNRKDWDDCKQELMSLLKISGHTNVMEVLDFFEVPMPAFVMRYVCGGDLMNHLSKKGKFTGKRAVSLLQGIGEGLRHLHSHAIVHRDLKSANILLEGKGSALRPVLIDLGLGKAVPKSLAEGKQYQTRGFCGTAHGAAPEMISSGMWSTKSDMYALGIIMWEILTGSFPYIDKKGFREVISFVHANGRPDAGEMQREKVSQKHQQLVKSLWDKDPAKRPSSDEFLAMTM
uniref:Protein kinase domain-containing protein n=1 Tax=Attheya septentrionalis TaxID=420275 RepID=A0A7S2XPP9_9STRA|mmetsp:Transcript_25887/g.46879  ORF Transcript_25887/g.46879 Transcript_25887/m.46879 type:complete len:688 (+) Transcript_25887:195-2258(+)|eukprot:CAMPEP_0198290972 /NCGR_PEP_ID=MMETSP1449-20131203/8649_1 /TAXON_ID=420275 /ORGANISM="Attheya septentrionalis, Strain CCMP2084" /LENGTH=687 /DNA_ID=CAMNT_0043989547 /DNA_START=171 /DNA_END=2234 /DNA_ORIENTATION=-